MLRSMNMKRQWTGLCAILCQQFRGQLELENMPRLRVVSVIFLLPLVVPFLLGCLGLLFGKIGIDLDSDL
jgi:hypothetical protein